MLYRCVQEHLETWPAQSRDGHYDAGPVRADVGGARVKQVLVARGTTLASAPAIFTNDNVWPGP